AGVAQALGGRQAVQRPEADLQAIGSRPVSERKADALVVFGITGDLARKQTFRALYRLEARKLLDCPVIGVASSDWDDDQLRDLMRQSVQNSGEEIDEDVVKRFAARLSYVSGNFADHKTYEHVKRA